MKAFKPYPWEWGKIFLRNKNKISRDIIDYFKSGTLAKIRYAELRNLSETLYYRMRQAESGRWNIDFAWELFCEIKPSTDRLTATDIVRAVALWSGHEWFGDKICRDVIYDKRCLKRFVLNERRV